MADILAVADIISKMTEGFERAVMQCVGDHASEARDILSEQIYSGVDGEGNYLSPTYDDDPYFESPDCPSWWRGKGGRYKQWKKEITPPVGGALIGYAPRPENVPNLWIDGTFHGTITATPKPDMLTIDVGGDPTSLDIVSKYGSQLLRLAPNSIRYLNDTYVRDAISRHFQNCGW